MRRTRSRSSLLQGLSRVVRRVRAGDLVALQPIERPISRDASAALADDRGDE
jgi:hypothetical protein